MKLKYLFLCFIVTLRAINASDIMTLDSATAVHKFKNLRHNFTDQGWQEYQLALAKSGILSELANGLNMKAKNLDSGNIIVSYSLPTYSYTQILKPSLQLENGKIMSFNASLISQSKIKYYWQKCKLQK